MYNVIIIGSGPAGHTAALYLARANLSPVLIEGTSSDTLFPGGLLTTTKIVENYPGFPKGVDGYELTERFKEQSTKFGTTILSETVTSITPTEGTFEVHTDKTTHKTRSVIIATGSTPYRLNIPGYDTFWHKGISTCAVCDGGLPCFRKVPIAVVGGGDSACEEALHISHTASTVYLIHRRNTLRASKIMAERVLSNPKIVPVWDSEVVRVSGDKHVESIHLKNTVTQEITELNVRGLFVAIGHQPNSAFVSNLVELDATGYIKTSRAMETSFPGIWAAGDVQDPKYRQAITAASSGCIAALEVERWLD